jgi:predicted phosphodiesterase
MARAGGLLDRTRAAPESKPEEERQRRRRFPLLTARRVLALTAVVVAALAGSYFALVSYRQDRELSVGGIRLSVSPGHRGALDLYVPLVDWGARFEAIRLPARLRVDLRTVDRQVASRIAGGAQFDVFQVRREASDEIGDYLRRLVVVVFLCGAALGVLMALALRSRVGPRLRWTAATGIGTALVTATAVALLLPPHGSLSNPEYYAHGPDIPGALEALESAQQSTQTLDQELDSQLVGLARLVAEPAGRVILEGQPHATVASDLHNNVLALPILERTARGSPVFFVGDLTDRGTNLEADVVRRVVRTGSEFVFVTGNHDSDSLARRLARDGAVVLTEVGRLHADGRYGGRVARVGGLRVAGYSDPFERRSADDFRDRYNDEPSDAQRQAFADWLGELIGKVDVVMVHEPELTTKALELLEEDPPDDPLVLLTGHSHKAALDRIENVTVINGGSVGAGGTGNLADDNQKLALARLTYESRPSFQPLAADLVEIDPGSGSSTARRERLDVPPETENGAERRLSDREG